MEQDNYKTKVIFRKFPEEDVIALFPEEPGDTRDPYSCMSYQHVGQHGSASPAIVDWTEPATPEEYADLLRELVSIGYDLEIHKKFTYTNQYERLVKSGWDKRLLDALDKEGCNG